MSVVVTVPMHPIAAGGSDPLAQQTVAGEEIVPVVSVSPDQIHLPAAANPEEEDVVVQEPAGSYPEYGRCVSPRSQQQVMELRGWLMVLATVIASITYASGLNPPVGIERVRQEIMDGVSPGAQPDHEPMPTSAASPAGPPYPGQHEHGILLALHEAGTRRYRAFYYCNTAAFSLSLSIVLLLASRDLRKLARTKALEVLVALDVLALLLAYIAGSTFGIMEFGICAGIVLVVPLALVFMSCCGKYFWDEL